MSTKQKRYFLSEDEIPTQWYNILADMPNKPLPPIHPGTKQPLTSKDVGDDARAQAFGAAAIQEVARATGLKSFPIISLVYQNFAGAYLDSMVRGGQDQYAEYINRRIRERGMVPMSWEINPQLGGQFAR